MLGCTDELRKAKRFKAAKRHVAAQVDAYEHRQAREDRDPALAREKSAKPKVLTRYEAPPPAAKKPTKTPKTKKQALAAAIEGNIDPALEVLLPLARRR